LIWGGAQRWVANKGRSCPGKSEVRNTKIEIGVVRGARNQADHLEWPKGNTIRPVCSISLEFRCGKGENRQVPRFLASIGKARVGDLHFLAKVKRIKVRAGASPQGLNKKLSDDRNGGSRTTPIALKSAIRANSGPKVC